MVPTKLLVLFALVAIVNCKYVTRRDKPVDHFVNILIDDTEDLLVDDQGIESVHPGYLKPLRIKRQTHGLMNTNPDGSFNIQSRKPLVGDNKNVLSAIGGINGLKPNGGFGAASGGLALDNANGHGLSVTGRHIPDFGNQLTGAARLNVINNDNHKLDANAFVTRNMPNIPNVPNFNTHGGSLDYMYKNKIGASLGASHTDFLKRTDYSAMGNMNLHRTPTSSLDLNAGFTRSVSPFIPNRNWQPSAGLSFTKYW